jgi:8-oxo-dGTP diphosphatase
VVELPVVQPDGAALLAFDRVAEGGPAFGSLVVLWRGEECLLVFHRRRNTWEVPGGRLDPGESAREAAFRELAEESGQRPELLDFVGNALYRGSDRRQRQLAIYRGKIDQAMPFEPNDEIAEIRWWNPAEPLAGLTRVDEAIARLCHWC